MGLRATKRNAYWEYLTSNPTEDFHKSIVISEINGRDPNLDTIDYPGITYNENYNQFSESFRDGLINYLKEKEIYSSVETSGSKMDLQTLESEKRICGKCRHEGIAAFRSCPQCKKSKFFPDDTVISTRGENLEFIYEIAKFYDPSAIQKVRLDSQRAIEFRFKVKEKPGGKVIGEGYVKKQFTSTFGLFDFAGNMGKLVKEAVTDIGDLIIYTEKSKWKGKIKKRSTLLP